MRLEDKVVIITGSCTGIGKAIARQCVKEGARVVIHGLEQAWGEALIEALGAEKSVLHIQDLTERSCPDALVELAVKTFGKLDAVVNNAALVASGNVHTTDEEFFSKILEVNTLAPFRLIQAALKELTAHRGSVLNIGSVNAWCGEPNLLQYSVSKGALMTMTRNLGDVLMRENGVRVNQINPGWILTENEAQRKRDQGLSEDWDTNLPKEYAPSGRILRPEEIAMAVIYWLADESGPISGQVVDLEQHPFIGRNLDKAASSMPT